MLISKTVDKLNGFLWRLKALSKLLGIHGKKGRSCVCVCTPAPPSTNGCSQESIKMLRIPCTGLEQACFSVLFSRILVGCGSWLGIMPAVCSPVHFQFSKFRSHESGPPVTCIVRIIVLLHGLKGLTTKHKFLFSSQGCLSLPVSFAY